jgi:hypothetical protein
MCRGSRPSRGFAAGTQDDGRLQAPEPGSGRADLDRTVLPVQLDIAEDPAPEPGKQLGVGTVEDQFAYTGDHGTQCTKRADGVRRYGCISTFTAVFLWLIKVSKPCSTSPPARSGQ